MSPKSLEGQTLGKYRLLEPLGRGGMAQVYKAYHPQLDRYVAIKMMRSDLVEEAEFLARFQREARSVAALRHPNIVQVYDFDAHEDQYYMVMELLEGDTLKTVLHAYRASGHRMPLGQVVRILSDVLAGLGYAHNEGIIHRDIKPANIMLTKRGQAVLTDFGIAQIVGATQYTVSGALMGTLSYMAPEQGLHGQTDPRSDIYSLGIVLFEMLTGQVPFDADTPLAILMKHVNDPLPLPHHFNKDIPEPFERVVLKALAKKPEDRFQDATGMLTALTDAAEQAEVPVPDALTHLPRLKSVSASETVGVFSGDSRQNILDNGFARDDTDITFNPPKTRPPVSKAVSDLPEALTSLLKVPEELTETDIRRENVSKGVLYSVAVLVGINLCGIWASGLTSWSFFEHFWPAELALVGLLLAALMATPASPWMLIPAGILIGTAAIMTYYALTGWWHHWAFLWPAQPLVVAVAIAGAIWLGRRGLPGRWLSRRLGYILITFSIGLIVLVTAASFWLTIFSNIVN